MAVCKSLKIKFEDLNILDAIEEWLQPRTSRKESLDEGEKGLIERPSI